MKIEEFKRHMIAKLGSFTDWYALERHNSDEPDAWPEEMAFADWLEQFDMTVYDF